MLIVLRMQQILKPRGEYHIEYHDQTHSKVESIHKGSEDKMPECDPCAGGQNASNEWVNGTKSLV